ncbi:TPA: tyrosine-type recombinase/integrase [Pseudomonas aeruginosa]|uniref:phage integrase n=2 Tax=Pseudomonas aeruginosa TaxID=287 RepID=UPI00228CFA00|nr:tyrosine-type recombinase/integrase [Pseudomonas aeruginosa]MCO3368739.1 integrase [Pseudomonas aeruginosa]MCO3371201.1 integrase [Pseudomonas aeruginosa]MCO3383658.1 integrase [Pseudomonas aeruginosa]HBN8422647.1 tyrosine-type recombinase/integrase [Pseudomonas aeruginosa]HBO0873125.1 tyrosine-type recombinase/integrase [Pseudomonas aeruginosa]
MSITKLPDGRWFVDVEPIKGKRFRKRFKTKGEAQRFEATVRQRCIENPAWSPKPKDRRRFSELVLLWYELHGHSLRDGKRRLSKLQQLTVRLGDPVATALDASSYAQLRRKRLENGISGKTLNNELGYVRAVFNELKDLGQIDYANPLVGVKPLKLQERELSWLTTEQITELLEAIRSGSDNPHTELVTLLCLATGARWSEAEKLIPQRLQGNVVTYAGTKSGRVRHVPIPTELADKIRVHWRTHGLFSSCITSFRRALERTTIRLPKGQASHALRHTFASHFMMNGGNILTLQKILGHSTLTMTMRYAHLSPDHLQEAISFGPLRRSAM